MPPARALEEAPRAPADEEIVKDRPLLYVCRGADCRKKSGKARDKLLSAAQGRVEVVDVRCQKICDGPVCGFEVAGTVEWFEEVDGRRSRKAAVAGPGSVEAVDDLPRALRKRRVKKRSGKLRT